ncbi:MAG TPA: MBL fold metallo-hydrolase [Hyphomicrobiales bacterium]|nr:MBL fold metallo-hydrolase [Hyphomicrobiales bacterium]
MATPQSDLDYPWPDPADPDAITEVAPGLRWLRMPVPGPLGHVNVYVLDDEAGWTIVDTGVPNDATRGRWQALLEGALAGRPVARILCTHGHPDHVGQAAWLHQATGATVMMTRRELDLARDPFGRILPQAEEVAAFYRRVGLEEDAIDGIVSRTFSREGARLPLEGEGVEVIAAGDVIAIGGRRWRIVGGSGHSPEHACLYDPEGRILLAGDQILPAISPNVSVFPRRPDADPLADFLASLKRLETLPEDTLVLPGHGLPFHGLHRRAAALARHHRDHLDNVVAALGEPAPASRILPVLFRRALEGVQLVLAVGEALAHLNFLIGQGRVTRLPAGAGPDLYLRAG